MPFHWAQGEHVAIIGQTGSGKTYLETRLIALREYVVVLKTKADDTKFGKDFVVAKAAAAMDNYRNERILLKPPYYHQAREGWLALEKAWHQGGWTFVIDELVRAEDLGLTDQINRGLTQGRSIKISMVCGMQRPSRVTRYALTEARHIFSFHLEGRDVKLLAESTTAAIEPIVTTLPKFTFVYYNVASRALVTGSADRLDEIFPRKPLDSDGREGNAPSHGIFRRLSLPKV